MRPARARARAMPSGQTRQTAGRPRRQMLDKRPLAKEASFPLLCAKMRRAGLLGDLGGTAPEAIAKPAAAWPHSVSASRKRQGELKANQAALKFFGRGRRHLL